MITKKILLSLLITLTLIPALALFGQVPQASTLRKSTSDVVIERKINALLAKMTLAEKLGQLQQLDGEANGKFRPSI